MNIKFENLIYENYIFRAAVPEDCDLIFSFINDDEIREQSFTSDKIIFSQHKKWFESKLKDENCLIVMAFEENTKKFCGQIKFDKITSDTALVGIFINPDMKGRGLGTKFLTVVTPVVCDYFNVVKVNAQIKKENLASLKAFSKAGYVFDSELEIKSIPAFQYIYYRRKDER